MPNIKSALKRLRQNVEKRAQNRHHMRAMRNSIRKFRRMVTDGEVNAAKDFLNDTYSQIDKMSKIGCIHSNKAARLKSRLSTSLRKATT